MDAPVSGGVSGATAGTLTIMIGADDATFDKVKPVFDVLGKNIYHVGEVGGGDAIKMVNNLLLGCNMAALTEALTLGVKCGLSVGDHEGSHSSPRAAATPWTPSWRNSLWPTSSQAALPWTCSTRTWDWPW